MATRQGPLSSIAAMLEQHRLDRAVPLQDRHQFRAAIPSKPYNPDWDPHWLFIHLHE
jgi:hypothetical protein